MEAVADFTFLGSNITVDDDCSHKIKKHLLRGRKGLSVIKSRDTTLMTKVHIVKAMLFHVWMWELDHKAGWVPKNWCSQIVVLERILKSPLVCKDIKPVNPKGNKPWIFIGKPDDKAEALLLWPPDAKNRLIGKEADPGKDWEQKEKAETENEMVECQHRLNGHEFEQTLGDSEEQRSLKFMQSQRVRWT